MTAAAATALKKLEINTVFDLATSGVFGDAAKLTTAGTSVQSVLYQHGSPTGDLVREAETAGKQVAELQFLPIGVLERIPAADVAGIQTPLDVQSVRDLALWLRTGPPSG